MGGRAIATAVAAIVMLAVAATAASARARVHYCGWVYPSQADAAMVRQSGTTCATGRAVVSFYGNLLRAPAGWRCRSGPYPDAVLVCKRGRATVTASVLP
jgi:hypothetical protein